jgi:16S rRNA (guanine527-N7)-methyltransferase
MAARREASAGVAADIDFEAACATLGSMLSRPQQAALFNYIDLLDRWNAVYNLTAVRDRGQMLTHHLLDCLAAVPSLRRLLGNDDGKSLLDVGSGGGLPGVVWAVTEPALQVACVDSVGKKAAFVRHVAAELKLPNLTSLQSRVEDLQNRSFDIVASRAFASLPDFVSVSRHALAEQGVWLAMKGKRPVEEISALPPDVEAFHVEQLEIPGLGAERCLVLMRPLH